jgi:hypothetical protein
MYAEYMHWVSNFSSLSLHHEDNIHRSRPYRKKTPKLILCNMRPPHLLLFDYLGTQHGEVFSQSNRYANIRPAGGQALAMMKRLQTMRIARQQTM